MSRTIICVVIFAAACSGSAPNNTGGGPADMAMMANPDLIDGEPSDMYPAPHPAPPQAVTQGGPVLTAPVIVPVFFSNEDATMQASLSDFESKVGATNYWHTATQEYGVGAATATAPVVLTETATGTIDDATIASWLAGKLNANDPAWPAATPNTVYVLHYPAGVTITLQTQSSCSAFGAYHSNTQLDAAHGDAFVAYAVIPRCTEAGMNTLDTTTGSTSHELIEAATDPFPMSDPAYASVDTDHRYWSRALGGGEVGDLCAQDPAAFTKFPELPYTVQRIWSNASATAGHDPCVPLLADEVYFNAAPELPDTIASGSMTNMTMIPGVHVPVGTSKTIALDLFSDGDTGGPFTIKVEDTAALFGGTATLGFALDQTSGVNGEKVQLTITTMSASTRGTATFAVITKLASKTHYWFGLVGEK